MRYRAVLFDLGGVVLTSPMEGFAAYEERVGLPVGLIRSLNATDPDDNAWARFERGDVDRAGFCELFEQQARAAGHRVDARAVLACLAGSARPVMLAALDRLAAAGVRRAAVTNNVAPMDAHDPRTADLLRRFDVVVESSVAKVRKPEPAFYALALERLACTAAECLFLDDLGVNLKPARSMGMTTIKVADPVVAVRELGDHLGLDLLTEDAACSAAER